MKDLNKVLQQTTQQLAGQTPLPTTELPNSNDSSSNQKHELLMLKLWKKISEIRGASFTNQYGNADGGAFNTWSDGLKGITPQQMKSALDKLVLGHCDYLDLPSFRTLCLDKGEYPSVESAYIEACLHSDNPKPSKFAHIAVYLAGKGLWYNLRMGEAKREYSSRYKAICDQGVTSEDYNDNQLEHASPVKSAEIDAEIKQQEIIDKLGIKKKSPKSSLADMKAMLNGNG